MKILERIPYSDWIRRRKATKAWFKKRFFKRRKPLARIHTDMEDNKRNASKGANAHHGEHCPPNSAGLAQMDSSGSENVEVLRNQIDGDDAGLGSAGTEEQENCDSIDAKEEERIHNSLNISKQTGSKEDKTQEEKAHAFKQVDIEKDRWLRDFYFIRRNGKDDCSKHAICRVDPGSDDSFVTDQCINNCLEEDLPESNPGPPVEWDTNAGTFNAIGILESRWHGDLMSHKDKGIKFPASSSTKDRFYVVKVPENQINQLRYDVIIGRDLIKKYKIVRLGDSPGDVFEQERRRPVEPVEDVDQALSEQDQEIARQREEMERRRREEAANSPPPPPQGNS